MRIESIDRTTYFRLPDTRLQIGIHAAEPMNDGGAVSLIGMVLGGQIIRQLAELFCQKRQSGLFTFFGTVPQRIVQREGMKAALYHVTKLFPIFTEQRQEIAASKKRR